MDNRDTILKTTTIVNSTGTTLAGRDCNVTNVQGDLTINNFITPGDNFVINTNVRSFKNMDEKYLITSFESILKYGKGKESTKQYILKGYSKQDAENLWLSLKNIGEANEEIVEKICDVFHTCTACGKNYDLADQLFPSAGLISSFTENWDSYGKISLEVNLSKMEYLYGNNYKAVQIGFNAKELLHKASLSQKQKEELESRIVSLLSEYDLSYIDQSVTTRESIYGEYSPDVLSALRCASCRLIGEGDFERAEYYLNEYERRRKPTISKRLTDEQTDKVNATHKGILWNRVVKLFAENRQNPARYREAINKFLKPDQIIGLRGNPLDKSYAYFILFHISDGQTKEIYRRLAKETFKEVKVQNHCTFDLNIFKQELQKI